MPAPRLLPLACLVVAGLVPGVAGAAAGGRIALLTALDGDAVVLRGDTRLAAVEGFALEAGDILQTGPQARLARLEYPSGLALALGPDTRALLEPPLEGETVYVLAGWAKLSAPKAVAAALGAPGLEVATGGGVAVVSLAPGATRVFAESGALALRSRPAGPIAQPLAAGQMLAIGAPGTAGAKLALSPRPTPAFVDAMPRAFMDSLPARAAAFQGRDVVPKRLGTVAWADAQPWVDAEPALRRSFVHRWRGLARDADFRRGLAADLPAHPEWAPVLAPPAPPHRNDAASRPATP